MTHCFFGQVIVLELKILYEGRFAATLIIKAFLKYNTSKKHSRPSQFFYVGYASNAMTGDYLFRMEVVLPFPRIIVHENLLEKG